MSVLEAAAEEGARIERAILLVKVEAWISQARNDQELQCLARVAALLKQRGV